MDKWDQIHRRLQAAHDALNGKLNPDKQARRQILRSRKKLLAEPLKSGSRHADSIEVVEFRLASETYAVEVRNVREICVVRELRRLTTLPPFVVGLIHVRGQIFSVVDLKKFFELPEKGLADVNKVLILRSEGMETGILVDEIHSVRFIAQEDLMPPPMTLTGIRAKFTVGVAAGPLVVLNAEMILSDAAILVNEG